MRKNIAGKTIFIIAILLVFTYGIFFGSDFDRSWDAIKTHGLLAGIGQNIHRGLDLTGGTHLVLQVAVNEAVAADSQRTIDMLKDDLSHAGVTFGDISIPNPTNQPEAIQIKGVPPDKTGDLHRIASDNFSRYDIQTGPDNSYSLVLKPSEATSLKNRAVQQAIDTIRGRVDTLGVSEPVIQEYGLGNYQILVQLPNVDDPMRVKDIMQSTAMLEIHQGMGGPYPDEQTAMAQNGGAIPADAVLLPGSNVGGHSEDSEGKDQYYLVSRSPVVAGDDVRSAQPGQDQNGRPAVTFNLTNAAGRRFQQFTSAHIGDNLAIVLDKRVREVARINGSIADSGIIEGAFTPQQTKDLSMVLSSGALPASIHYLQESTVGPSLGADSIRAGIMAAVIGMAAVMLFMLVYYHGAGINADLALVLNLIILLGFLGFSGATLTLPGIAGVILTIGMGVDSNVLIFERIREELRAGKPPAAAVDQGFGRAWVTILDTHVTTIVSAFILFIFGSGPVRGFAVTLTFGLLANLFTAVYVSRVIFDALLNRKQRGEALSI